MTRDDITRRRVLQGVAAGVAATGVAGAADSGRKIVGLKSSAGFGAATKRADHVHRQLDFGGIGKAVAGRFSAEALDALENNPNVRYVEDDSTYHALAQTTPWGVDRVDADVAHGNGFTGDGADVAIVDTGIDDDHPDLQGNLGSGEAFVNCGSSGGCRFGAQPNDNACNFTWSDDNDHGTHCAGTADAVDDDEGVVGVSTGATLHAVKVLDGCGSGSLSDVAAGIEYVADQGWDVASMSLGASSGDQTLADAVQYAADNGVLLVAAAGNSGPCTDCVGFPAAYPEVVAVSSTDEDDGLSDFSSTGPEVELAAPGGAVLSTVPPESSSDGLDTFSGTSMATPHVAGAGGLLMANGQSAGEARSTLASTAEDLGLASNEQGNGLLDAEAATNALGDGGGSNSAPAVDSVSAAEVETSDGDAEFDVSWSVSDPDGNLSSVDLSLTDDTAGASEDSASVGVSGSSASGTTRLVAAGDDGSGNSYTVGVTVTDGSGATGSGSTTVGETESTSSAPAIDSYSVTEAGSPNPHAEITADWSVSDSDGDLSSVLVEVFDSSGSLADSQTTSVSGSSASGSDSFTIQHGGGATYDVTLTVTDAGGNTASDTRSVSS